jgi:hypothetical protein
MSRSEAQISTEQLEQVAKEVAERVKELRLDGKLREETGRLMNIVHDMRDWLGRVPSFAVKPVLAYSIDAFENAVVEYIVQGREIRSYVKLNARIGEVKVIDVYRKFFEDAGVLEFLLSRYVETLASIAATVRESYDLVEKLRQIEERLSDP